MTGAALTAFFLSTVIAGRAITVRRPRRVAITLAVTAAAWLALAVARATGAEDGSTATASAIALLQALSAALWGTVAWLDTHPPATFRPVSPARESAVRIDDSTTGELTGARRARRSRCPAAAPLIKPQPIS